MLITEHLNENSMVLPLRMESSKACRWTIIQTRPRHEKLLASEMSGLGVSSYLPLVHHVQIFGGRRIDASLPLFPGYLFLHGTAKDVGAALKTRRVAKVIDVPDQKRIDWELRNLRAALSEMDQLDAHPYVKSGLRAEVKTGSLRGLQGLVEERLNPSRLVLQVGMLGQAVSLDIEAYELDILAG
jgi:hypothetical protein